MLVKNGLVVEENDPDGGSMFWLSGEGKELLKMYRVLRARLNKEVEKEHVRLW